jgi:hypothetical protein
MNELTAMTDPSSLKYRVSIKHLAERPMVGADGHCTQAVEFHVEPLTEPSGTSPFDVDGGSVCGETLYRSSLLQEKHNLIVELPASWLRSRSPHWQQEVVDLALQQAASECA